MTAANGAWLFKFENKKQYICFKYFENLYSRIIIGVIIDQYSGYQRFLISCAAFGFRRTRRKKKPPLPTQSNWKTLKKQKTFPCYAVTKKNHANMNLQVLKIIWTKWRKKLAVGLYWKINLTRGNLRANQSYLPIYTSHLCGNLVHKHKTIKFYLLGERPSSKYTQISRTDWKE